MSSFTSITALSILESTEEFPVDFDQAVEWIGYAKKQNAKNKLVKNFEEGFDYTLTQMRESASSGGFTHREDIKLTYDCFKQLGMMAGTEKGKQIRRYFLECERRLKRSQDIQNLIADRMADRMIVGIVAALEPRLTAIEAKLNARSVDKPKVKPTLQLLQGDLGEDCRTEEDKKRERQEIYNLLKGR